MTKKCSEVFLQILSALDFIGSFIYIIEISYYSSHGYVQIGWFHSLMIISSIFHIISIVMVYIGIETKNYDLLNSYLIFCICFAIHFFILSILISNDEASLNMMKPYLSNIDNKNVKTVVILSTSISCVYYIGMSILTFYVYRFKHRDEIIITPKTYFSSVKYNKATNTDKV